MLTKIKVVFHKGVFLVFLQEICIKNVKLKDNKKQRAWGGPKAKKGHYQHHDKKVVIVQHGKKDAGKTIEAMTSCGTTRSCFKNELVYLQKL